MNGKKCPNILNHEKCAILKALMSDDNIGYKITRTARKTF